MRRFLWAIPLATFFLNPSFACGGPTAPGFDYGAPEMSAAVGGTWMLTFTPDGGAITHVTFTVEQAAGPAAPTARAPRRGLVRAAQACGTRTLVRAAAACIDLTEMPLAVKFVAGDETLATAALSGTFRVYGTQFSYGDLELVLGPYHVVTGVDRFGALVGTRLSAPGPGGAITIVEREP
jgi:hypothetical protein